MYISKLAVLALTTLYSPLIGSGKVLICTSTTVLEVKLVNLKTYSVKSEESGYIVNESRLPNASRTLLTLTSKYCFCLLASPGLKKDISNSSLLTFNVYLYDDPS